MKITLSATNIKITITDEQGNVILSVGTPEYHLYCDAAGLIKAMQNLDSLVKSMTPKPDKDDE